MDKEKLRPKDVDAFFGDDSMQSKGPLSFGTTTNLRQLLATSRVPEYPLDTLDLVTGENIINVQGNERISGEEWHAILKGLREAVLRTRNGETVYIRNIVETCDRNAFPGFQRILSPTQREQLDQADRALAEHCFRNLIRFAHASNTQKIISAVDRGLNIHIQPLLTNIPTPETKQSIEEALNLWRANTDNPWKNLYQRCDRPTKKEDRVGREYVLPLYLQNPHYFSIGILRDPRHQTISAGYDPTERALLLHQSPMGEYHFLEMMHVLHELTHICQHNRFLSHHGEGDAQKIKAYHQAYIAHIMKSEHLNELAYGILEDESEAFANEIETINAHTPFEADTQRMLEKLDVPRTAQFERELGNIGRFAVEYYGGGKRTGSTFPPNYMNAINELYSSINIRMIRYADIETPE